MNETRGLVQGLVAGAVEGSWSWVAEQVRGPSLGLCFLRWDVGR